MPRQLLSQTEAARVFQVASAQRSTESGTAGRGGSRSVDCCGTGSGSGRSPRARRWPPPPCRPGCRSDHDRRHVCPSTQLRLPFTLWTRVLPSGSSLAPRLRRWNPCRCGSVGRYLQQWGLTPQKHDDPGLRTESGAAGMQPSTAWTRLVPRLRADALRVGTRNSTGAMRWGFGLTIMPVGPAIEPTGAHIARLW